MQPEFSSLAGVFGFVDFRFKYAPELQSEVDRIQRGLAAGNLTAQEAFHRLARVGTSTNSVVRLVDE